MLEGEVVKIKYSKQLLQLRLCELVTRKAVVTKVAYNDLGNVRGAYVIPQTGRLRGQEWYIPIQSIESQSDINRLRNHSTIRQTIL